MLLVCTLYGKLNCEPNIELVYTKLSPAEDSIIFSLANNIYKTFKTRHALI